MAKILYNNRDEFLKGISKRLEDEGVDLEDDGSGQQVIYTGVFAWADGTYRDECEE